MYSNSRYQQIKKLFDDQSDQQLLEFLSSFIDTVQLYDNFQYQQLTDSEQKEYLEDYQETLEYIRWRISNHRNSPTPFQTLLVKLDIIYRNNFECNIPNPS